MYRASDGVCDVYDESDEVGVAPREYIRQTPKLWSVILADDSWRDASFCFHSSILPPPAILFSLPHFFHHHHHEITLSLYHTVLQLTQRAVQ